MIIVQKYVTRWLELPPIKCSVLLKDWRASSEHVAEGVHKCVVGISFSLFLSPVQSVPIHRVHNRNLGNATMARLTKCPRFGFFLGGGRGRGGYKRNNLLLLFQKLHGIFF